MVMFAICTMRSTIHDTHARNAFQWTTQSSWPSTYCFPFSCVDLTEEFVSKIQMVELEQKLSLLSVLGDPLRHLRDAEKCPVHSW